MSESDNCKWLHWQLQSLSLISFPYDPESLPKNGIYFLYEKGEVWGHGGVKQRIVRVGTHTGEGRFRGRIAEHFLPDGLKMKEGKPDEPAAVRSIFRKNIGRVLLTREGDSEFLRVWNMSHIDKARELRRQGRADIAKDKRLQRRISEIIRETFSFRFIPAQGKQGRIELEELCIGTLARCGSCRPSSGWLGLDSPISEIRQHGLWLIKGLRSPGFDSATRKLLEDI